MKKILYEKFGATYVPVSEYDPVMFESFPEGAHLVISKPGGQSRIYNVDPDYASLIAAGQVAIDAMCKSIQKASELRPAKTPITIAQQKAWKKLAKEFGDELCTLNGCSAREIAESGLKALQDEAKMLQSNTAVRKSYEQYLLMCKLSKEET